MSISSLTQANNIIQQMTKVNQLVASINTMVANSTSGTSTFANLTITSGLVFSGVITPTTISADQNDYSPTGLGTASIIRLSSDATRILTGLAAQTSGRTIVIQNVGANRITIRNQNAGSSAANRFALASADIILQSGQNIVVQYDGTSSRWRVIAGPDPSGSLLNQTLTGNTTIANTFFSGNFHYQGILSPSQITATQNDYSPTNLATSCILRLTSDAARIITGLAGGANGRFMVIENVGSFTITLKHQNTGSTATNRFLFAAGGDINLAANQSVIMIYDSIAGRWIDIAAPYQGSMLNFIGTGNTTLANTSIAGNLQTTGIISPSIVANQDDWTPSGLTTASVIRLTSDAARTISGLTGGAAGRLIFLHNVGSFNITISNASIASSAANRFLFPTGFDVLLRPGMNIVFQYDGTQSRWLAIAGPSPSQHANNKLTSITDLSLGTADKGIYTTAANTFGTYTIRTTGRALSALAGTIDQVPYYTSNSAVSQTPFRPAGRAIVGMTSPAGKWKVPYWNSNTTTSVTSTDITPMGASLLNTPVNTIGAWQTVYITSNTSSSGAISPIKPSGLALLATSNPALKWNIPYLVSNTSTAPSLAALTSIGLGYLSSTNVTGKWNFHYYQSNTAASIATSNVTPVGLGFLQRTNAVGKWNIVYAQSNTAASVVTANVSPTGLGFLRTTNPAGKWNIIYTQSNTLTMTSQPVNPQGLALLNMTPTAAGLWEIPYYTSNTSSSAGFTPIRPAGLSLLGAVGTATGAWRLPYLTSNTSSAATSAPFSPTGIALVQTPTNTTGAWKVPYLTSNTTSSAALTTVTPLGLGYLAATNAVGKWNLNYFQSNTSTVSSANVAPVGIGFLAATNVTGKWNMFYFTSNTAVSRASANVTPTGLALVKTVGTASKWMLPYVTSNTNSQASTTALTPSGQSLLATSQAAASKWVVPYLTSNTSTSGSTQAIKPGGLSLLSIAGTATGAWVLPYLTSNTSSSGAVSAIKPGGLALAALVGSVDQVPIFSSNSAATTTAMRPGGKALAGLVGVASSVPVFTSNTAANTMPLTYFLPRSNGVAIGLSLNSTTPAGANSAVTKSWVGSNFTSNTYTIANYVNKIGSTASGLTTTNLTAAGNTTYTGAQIFSGAAVITPAQITANQNDYTPTGLASASVIRLSSDASRNITGLAGGTSARVLVLINVGAQPIVLKNLDAGSLAANRFNISADATLGAATGAILMYDSTQSYWELISQYSTAASVTQAFVLDTSVAMSIALG